MWWRHEGSSWWSGNERQRLVEESEAFLTGCLIEHFGDLHESGPSWLFLSTLAHGSKDAIASLGDGRYGWALAFLSNEILAVAGCDDALTELQRSALIPLELEIMCDGTCNGMRDLVHRTLNAIRSFRSSP